MLKGIPSIISPELLKILMEMGHGDEIVIADGNFPGASHAKMLVRADGHGVPELLEAILKLMPLDSYANNVYLMQTMDCDKDLEIPIWDEYKKIAAKHTDKAPEMVDRFDFYEQAKKAYAVIATGETAIYANVILKKGVVVE
jgi:Fucose dissimilation pathway protein FucU